jgi:hypothetical protein
MARDRQEIDDAFASSFIEQPAAAYAAAGYK